MDDDRIWSFEESLWTADAAHYEESIDDECVMVVPTPPFVMTGEQAIESVQSTPRWSSVSFSDQQIMRPQEGLIVVGYTLRSRSYGVFTLWLGQALIIALILVHILRAVAAG